MIRTAFVVAWFGRDLVGEAEHYVFQVATRLAKRGHEIEVLTTCCRSSRDDRRQNHLPEGAAEESGVSVRRFPVRPGNGDDDIHSPMLLDYLERNRDSYHAIVFAPVACEPTLLGVQLVPKRAFLLPLLHDESRARLPAVEAIFHTVKGIFFLSEEEALLAAGLYGPSVWRTGKVVGGGAGEQADWSKIIDRYEEALQLRPAARIRPAPSPPTSAIHQLSPSLDYGDAISNQTVFISEVLRELGYESEIFVLDIGAQVQDLAKVFKPGVIGPHDGLLYHHAIGTSLTAHAIQHSGPKALFYHNITPGHFFAPWDPKFAGILEMGRTDLHNLAPAFPVSVGDSSYNAAELRDAGFRDPGVLPIFVDPMRWAQPADPEWMKTLQDGRTNILFVGRMAPNKCQHHLLEAFKEYLSFDPEARLLLVGVWPKGHPYVRFLRDEAERLGISRHVFMTWRVTEAQLLACYRTAHLFWSMSEHEGFCVPLIEAMWFDVPVLAYRSSAIPETLGPAGLMFTEKNRWPEIAALAHLLVEDQALRRTVIAAQRARRSAFLPEAILPLLLKLLSRLGPDVRDELAIRVHDQGPAIVGKDELLTLGAQPAPHRRLV